jgi:hypothetical protein
VKRIAWVLLPYAVFSVLLLLSWNRWIEPYIDSGRELMVPWRISQGERLYRDVHFHHGPLAVYVGAGIDRVAGRSLAARIGLGAALALLHLETLRRLSSRFLKPGDAALATALAVAVAFFLRPGGWMFPFSFDTAIAVAALTGALLFSQAKTRRGDTWVAAALTAALLSRVELGLAGLAAMVWETRGERSRWPTIAGAPLAIAGAGYGLLSAGVSLDSLIRDGWLRVVKPPEAFQNVYRTYAGLDEPALRLAEMGLAIIAVLIVTAGLAAGSAAAARSGPRGGMIVQAFTLALAAAAAVLSLFPPDLLVPTLRLLPPLIRIVPPLILGAFFWRLISAWRQRPHSLPAISDATWLVAILFSGRLLLAAGYVGPYDAFFLPLPITLAAAMALRTSQGATRVLGRALPALTTGALTIFLLFRLGAQAGGFRGPGWTPVVTPAGGVVLREPVAATTRLALAELARRVPEDGRMVGFPEGGFFNYVLGRKSLTPFEQVFPGHADTAEDERRIIQQLGSSPPNAVFLCDVLAVGEHHPAFGRDYLIALDRFVRERFVAVASFGPGAGLEARIGDPQFFVTIRVPRRR